MNDLYPAIKLDTVDQAKLRALKDKELGMQRFIDQLIQSGEQRAAEIQAQFRALWTEMAVKYKLDMEHVNYSASPDFTELVPMAVKLA